MTVIGIEHVNIRTPLVAETIGFFRDVLGMDVRPVPGSENCTRGGWVYAADESAVVHIGATDAVYPGDGAERPSAGTGSGAIHHVALNCTDYDAVRTRLERLGADLAINDVPDFGIRQLFVRDPNNVLVELNFREALASGS